MIGPIFPADLAALDILARAACRRPLREFGAMRAGDRGIFDELHRRVGIAHAEAASRSSVTIWVQSPLLGAAICVSGAPAARPPPTEMLPPPPPQPARARASARRADRQICSHFFLSPPIRPTTGIVGTTGAPSPAERPRASDSRQARSSGSTISRSESPSSAGIGRSDGGAGARLAFCRLNRALPDRDPVDRRIAEEAVDPLVDRRRDMLHHRRVRALDDQGEHAGALLAGRKADRFGRGDGGVALADDLAPAADDRGLDEAEAAEGGAAGRRQQIRHGARAPRARRLGRRASCAFRARSWSLCFPLFGRAWHRRPMPVDAAQALLCWYVVDKRAAALARRRRRARPTPIGSGCPR